jgi:hypothetical protein
VDQIVDFASAERGRKFRRPAAEEKISFWMNLATHLSTQVERLALLGLDNILQGFLGKIGAIGELVELHNVAAVVLLVVEPARTE